jgi:hypothetical protein
MASLLTTSSQLMCPHGGTVTISTSNSRPRAASSPIVRANDTFTVAGCPFVLGTAPHPCTQVQWIQPATQNRCAGSFVLTEQSVGMCVAADQAPQGTVQVVAAQPKTGGR